MTNIIIFGSSTVYWVWDNEKWWWCERLKSSLPDTIYNCWILWDTTKEIKKRIINEYKSRNNFNLDKKVKILIQIWLNDSRYLWEKLKPQMRKKQFQKNILEIYEKLKKDKNININKDVFFIWPTEVDESLTLPWKRDRYWKNERIIEFNNILKDFCKEKNLKFINQINLLNKNELQDWIHPNSNWHEKIFQKIYNISKKFDT